MRIVRWYIDRTRREGFDLRWKARSDLAMVLAAIVLILAFIAYSDPEWVQVGK